jgi:hypothetical protein
LSLKLTSPDNKDELLISSLLKHKNIKIQQKNNKMIIEMDLKKFGLKNDLNTNHRYHLEIQHRFAHPGKKALGFFKDKMILKVKKDNIKP